MTLTGIESTVPLGIVKCELSVPGSGSARGIVTVCAACGVS